MDAILAALADPARWRLVELLAGRPRPVGVLAQLAAARQPQTTKHLQTLERAGLVTAQRHGQRRIYALNAERLRELAAELVRLADAARDGSGEEFERYAKSVQAERLAADTAGWADGRSFRFDRSMAAPPQVVWRHLTDAGLLATWWAPDSLRVSELVFEARPGGRIVQEYRDAEDLDGSDVVVGRAEGTVEAVQTGTRLAYHLSPLAPGGGRAFTAHLEFHLAAAGGGTALGIQYRITGSTVDAADFIAGIEIGFGQSLDRLAAIVAAGTDPGSTP